MILEISNSLIFSRILATKSEGKKYWLNDIKDEGRATESIARLLSYGASKDANASFKDSGDEAATEAPAE